MLSSERLGTPEGGPSLPSDFSLFDPGPKTNVNFTPETLERHIMLALDRRLPPFRRWPTRSEPVLIVANGPSLLKTVSDVRARARDGAKILCVNGAHDFLLDHGLIPWGHALMDAADHVADVILRRPHPDVIYFVASQCHPSVFDALAGHDVVLWHAWEGMGEEDILVRELGRDGEPWALIPGGCTVTLRAFPLAALMGFREMHLYGFDCCFSADRQHAHPQGTTYRSEITARVGRRTFLTSPALCRQAVNFQEYVRDWDGCCPGTTLTLHGDGLAAEMMHERARLIAMQREAS